VIHVQSTRLLAVILSGACLTLPAADRYSFVDNHHPDATGKVYMHREIAQVMGHEGAGWLERPERDQEEMPRLLMELLELKPGMVVADIGAGSGYHTRRMAKAVAPNGKVMAVDIQPEMLQILTNKLTTEGITNVVPILGAIDDPNLPDASVDLALMVDVYHEFSHPYEMMEGITRALKPGGRVVFVEYRGEDKWVPIKEHHKMTEAQVKKEMTAQSLKWTRTVSDKFPWQHLIVFEKVTVPKSD
jgi:ubiquinone/menaquinone biosynthesis C-methylase UbiE